MENFFLDLTVIICIASLLSIVSRILKQPEILAYILTGILIAPFHFFSQHDQPLLNSMSQVGITLLLFMVGLEIRISELFSLGKTLLIASFSQIIFSFLGGFLLSGLFGFNFLSSVYVSTALTFSSTIIVVKLLSDKRDMHALYAKFSLGILLVQDVLAILVLMMLSGLNQQTGAFESISNFIFIALKASVVVGVIAYLSKRIFPQIIERIAKSSETLFLSSLAWVFGLAALVSSKFMGFSIEIGGFLAGVALANSIANYQIIAKAKILRDFFIVIFFVLLGIQMSFSSVYKIIIPAVVISLFVLVVKPLIVMITMGILGYRKRTSFLTGISLSQVSEFSLIIIFLGNKIGLISKDLVSLITLVCLITFFVSTYLIMNANKFYRSISHHLWLFERKDFKKDEMSEEGELDNLKDHVVVIGGDQMGKSIVEALEDLGKDVVVVDFDPAIVVSIKGKKIHKLFGDIADLEIQKRASIDSAKLVVSTIPDTEDNLMLLNELNHENRRAKIVMMAFDWQDAKILYKKGADYVVLPHLAGGRQIAKLITEDTLSKLDKLKEKDKKYLD